MNPQSTSQQNELNRQLIDALVHGDATCAFSLVNNGADPNARLTQQPTSSVKTLLKQLLRLVPSLSNDTDTAFILACRIHWNLSCDNSISSVAMDENLPLLEAMLAHGADIHAKGYV